MVTVSSLHSGSSELAYGAFAVALYASPDLPHPERRRLTLQELAGYARQGIKRLGGADRVHALHEDLLRANRARLHGCVTGAEYDALVAQVLSAISGDQPDIDRFNRCIRDDFARILSR